jgi:hypothetical protein
VKTPALVAVEQPPEAFAQLFAAARGRGVRVGWLDLGGEAAPPPAAVAAGAAKSVVAVPGRVVAVKRVVGEPVLHDLLREHFLGYAIVLVSGRAGTPRLRGEGDGFRLESALPPRQFGAEALLDELLRPAHRFGRRRAR